MKIRENGRGKRVSLRNHSSWFSMPSDFRRTLTLVIELNDGISRIVSRQPTHMSIYADEGVTVELIPSIFFPRRYSHDRTHNGICTMSARFSWQIGRSERRDLRWLARLPVVSVDSVCPLTHTLECVYMWLPIASSVISKTWFMPVLTLLSSTSKYPFVRIFLREWNRLADSIFIRLSILRVE